MPESEHVLPNDHLKNRAVVGRVSQVHRGVRCAEEGDTFEAMGSTFEVTEVTERTIGDLELADARKEEETSLPQLLSRLQLDYEGEMHEDLPVYRYRFERAPSL